MYGIYIYANINGVYMVLHGSYGIWFPIPMSIYVHPVTLESGTQIWSQGPAHYRVWTQIPRQNQLIKRTITNLYSQKPLKQTTRQQKKHETHMKEPNIQNYM